MTTVTSSNASLERQEPQGLLSLAAMPAESGRIPRACYHWQQRQLRVSGAPGPAVTGINAS